ncbi:hypothetical protein GCM10007425_05690 [Lysinibacillus alkalisoli]|uniref:Uncharacterized protein n=1 Tax=Lysinibacillus alkalisoli TaxID=1911548 RepID=A0A917FYL0_9BACI|nr:hypothetical protein [Lysinibacillus alkalisoli]GGG14292.1 hypothetical protein GCM10007425_05690 [Lysinibacillus alkalisoli]
MRIRVLKIGVTSFALTIVVAYIGVKIMKAQAINLTDVATVGVLTGLLFSSMTWQEKDEEGGIQQNEKIGRRIQGQSTKISYYILLVVILGAAVIEQVTYHMVHPTTLMIMGMSLILVPVVDFILVRKHQ